MTRQVLHDGRRTGHGEEDPRASRDPLFGVAISYQLL